MSHPTTHVMTCTECLSSVATADVLELTTSAAVAEHCRTCGDCAGVIDEVAREERRMADTLDGLPPGVPAQVVALRAVAGAARGRRRSRRVRIALAAVAAAAAPLLAVVLLRDATGGQSPAAVRTRNVELQCLSPVHAAVLVPPALPRELARGIRISVSPHDLPILTVSGTPRDLAAAEQVIARIDARWGAERSEYCAVPPRQVAPGASVPAQGQPTATAVITPSVPTRVPAR